MSRWDKCCRSGTFNKNFGSNKISGERPSRNEVFILREPETSTRSSISTFDTDNYAVEETDFCYEVSFSDMQFHVKLLKEINEAGFYHPRKTQKEILSSLFERFYRCYVIHAPDKSGKTSVILLWILNELLHDETKEYPKALIVCPTHEIAESTYLFAEKIAKNCEIKVCLVKKGTHFNKSDKMIDLIISTPEKILHLAETSMSIQNVKIFILNEAHCMSSSPGNLRTVSRIKSRVSSRCCYMICTAFINKILYDFINSLSLQYKKIEIESSMKKYPFKEVFVIYSSMEERVNALKCLEDFKHCQDQTVVFCCNKDTLTQLKNCLKTECLSYEVLTGGSNGLTVSQRKYVLEQFKENKFKVLISTYSFLRVIEAKNVTKVINFEQILNEKRKLDIEKYKESKIPLNCKKSCLVVNFIEKSWENFLLKDQTTSDESHFFANTTIKSALELLKDMSI
ncbi:ATP-dependent RNA helicase DBP5 [Trichonephila clavata]|uniref:ATP-dependent RNA helicase DBP5 n=1 Tax=Trichonephila clavata TaxID=2740835 RepID=A0A8X6IE74_TRICU|nr:ATP-dependent RNA helicase DBP5 [Trichonephila clavata]